MSDATKARSVFQWPEARAFLERLGVDLTLPIRSVTIRLYPNAVPLVTVEHLGADRPAEGKPS